jgi:hypothetical protein
LAVFFGGPSKKLSHQNLGDLRVEFEMFFKIGKSQLGRLKNLFISNWILWQ